MTVRPIPLTSSFKYEAVVESNGGTSITEAKALIMSLKGVAQTWYSRLPKGLVESWLHLRGRLLTAFRNSQPEELTPAELMHVCTQGVGERNLTRLHPQSSEGRGQRAEGIRKPPHQLHHRGAANRVMPGLPRSSQTSEHHRAVRDNATLCEVRPRPQKTDRSLECSKEAENTTKCTQTVAT